MGNDPKPVYWVGSSLNDVKGFLKAIQKHVGFTLFLAQLGGKHADAKPLKGFGGAGVLEVVASYDGESYRAVYTMRFADGLYVLHCFQKKSKSGIETPKQEIEMVRGRLAALERKRSTMKKNESDQVEEAAVAYQEFDCEILPGSGNVFADLGLQNAEAHVDKAKLAAVIHSAVKERGLTQAQAAKAMKLDQPKVSKIIRGDFRDFSVERLLTCVIRLGFNVDVTIRSQPMDVSQIGRFSINLT